MKSARIRRFAFAGVVLWLSATLFALLTPWGLRSLCWALEHSFAELRLEQPQGSVLTGFGVRRVEWRGRDLHLRIDALQLDWRVAALIGGRVQLQQASAARAVVYVPSSPTPTALPNDLVLPLGVDLRRLQLDALYWLTADFDEELAAAVPVAQRLVATLVGDAQGYRLEVLHAELAFGVLDAQAELANRAPFALQGEVRLQGRGEARVHSRLTARLHGSLSDIGVTLHGQVGTMAMGNGEARVTPFAALPLAQLRLELSDLNPQAFMPQAPQARLRVSADLHRPAASSAGDVLLSGHIEAHNAEPRSFDRGGVPLSSLRAELALGADFGRLQAMQLTLPGGGALQGHLTWKATPVLKVEADWAVAALDLAVLDRRLRPSRLQGQVRLQGDAAQQVATLNLSDGRVSAEVLATRRGDAIRLQRLRLARGQAELRGAGELDLSGARAFRFSGELRRFDLAAWMQSPSSDLNASLELSGQLQPQPRGAARLMLTDSRFAGQPLSGQATLDLSAGQRWRGAVELMLGGNRLHAQGEYGKHGDSAAHADDSLRVTLDAPALSRLGLGWGGVLTARLNWRGPLMPQAMLQTVWPTQIQAEFDANGRELSVGGHLVASLHSHVQLQAGALRGALHADDWRQEHAGESRRWAQRLEASLSGAPMQHELHAKWHLDARQTLTTRIEGSVARFAGAASVWQGRIAAAALTGPWALRLLTPWPLTVDGARVSLGAATFQLAEGQVEHIASLWTPTSWQTQGRFGGLRVASWLDATTVLPSTLRLGGDWRLAQSAPGQAPLGTINLQREQGDWLLAAEPPLALGLQQLQVAANLTQGQLRIEAQARGERLGEWRAELSAPLTGGAGEWVARDAPIVGRLNGQLRDMSWIGPSIDGNIQSGGRLSVDLGIDGSRAAPVLSGAVQGEDLALSLLDQGVRLRQGQLRARFEGERLTIDRLDFVAPPSPPPKDRLISRIAAASEAGFVKASGRVDFGARRAQLTLNAQGLPVTPGKDRWLLATAQLQLDLRRELLKLSGKIGADAAFFGQSAASRPQLAEDVRRIDVNSDARTPAAMHLDLDLEVDVGERCYVRAGGLEARLAGRVKLRGEALRSLSGLRATGAITAREAGFEAYGQRLNVERAIVNFQGPIEDPGLNVVARRSGLPVEAGVEVSGTARAPRVRLISTPQVPDAEKLSWLVLGRAPDAGGMDAALLLSAAGSLLGSQSENMPRRLAAAFGVDELSLRQAGQAGQDAGLSGQIVSVGKRLSSRAFLSYEQGLSTAAGVLKLSYRLNPRLSLVTRAGTENALDVLYTFSFD